MEPDHTFEMHELRFLKKLKSWPLHPQGKELHDIFIQTLPIWLVDLAHHLRLDTNFKVLCTTLNNLYLSAQDLRRVPDSDSPEWDTVRRQRAAEGRTMRRMPDHYAREHSEERTRPQRGRPAVAAAMSTAPSDTLELTLLAAIKSLRDDLGHELDAIRKEFATAIADMQKEIDKLKPVAPYAPHPRPPAPYGAQPARPGYAHSGERGWPPQQAPRGPGPSQAGPVVSMGRAQHDYGESARQAMAATFRSNGAFLTSAVEPPSVPFGPLPL
jgi:hypothetical protein